MADRLDKVREAAGALCDYLDETSGGAEWKGAPLVRRLRAALDATLAAPTDKVREAAERWASSEVDAYPGRTLEDRIKSWMAGGVHPDDVEWFLIDAYEAGYRAALAAPSGGDATPRDEAVVALPTRGDVGRPEATRDPVFLLRYRHRGDNPDRNRWHVDSVWFTREEAEAFGNNHAHRWGKDKSGPRWQVYCVPAGGDLAALLKARTLVPKGGAR